MGFRFKKAESFDGSGGIHSYIENDPIGLLGGLNRYAYVRADPLGLIDPLGLAPNPVCVAACTAAGGFIGGAIGAIGGGVVGGSLGAAGGTLVAPGVGTVTGGSAGATAGSEIGGAVGATAGGAAGNAVGKAACPDDTKPDCDEEIAACSKICARAQTDPDMRHVYGGSISQCMRGCLPEKCGGEPKWQGGKKYYNK